MEKARPPQSQVSPSGARKKRKFNPKRVEARVAPSEPETGKWKTGSLKNGIKWNETHVGGVGGSGFALIQRPRMRTGLRGRRGGWSGRRARGLGGIPPPPLPQFPPVGNEVHVPFRGFQSSRGVPATVTPAELRERRRELIDKPSKGKWEGAAKTPRSGDRATQVGLGGGTPEDVTRPHVTARDGDGDPAPLPACRPPASRRQHRRGRRARGGTSQGDPRAGQEMGPGPPRAQAAPCRGQTTTFLTSLGNGEVCARPRSRAGGRACGGLAV